MQDGEQSEMIRSLDKLVKCVGVAIIHIGLVLFWQAFFVQHDGFRDSITSMVAAVIGMIPEGLYLLASVALAVSSIRLAKKKVLLHDMKCIETLARVDVCAWTRPERSPRIRCRYRMLSRQKNMMRVQCLRTV